MGASFSLAPTIQSWTLLGEKVQTVASSSMLVDQLPSGYKYLMVMIEVKTAAADTLRVRFNADAGNNYVNFKAKFLPGNTFETQSSVTSAILGASVSQFFYCLSQITISQLPTGANKGFFMTGGSDTEGNVTTGYWTGTAEIASVEIQPIGVTNLSIGSRLTVYGVQ